MKTFIISLVTFLLCSHAMAFNSHLMANTELSIGSEVEIVDQLAEANAQYYSPIDINYQADFLLFYKLILGAHVELGHNKNSIQIKSGYVFYDDRGVVVAALLHTGFSKIKNTPESLNKLTEENGAQLLLLTYHGKAAVGVNSYPHINAVEFLSEIEYSFKYLKVRFEISYLNSLATDDGRIDAYIELSTTLDEESGLSFYTGFGHRRVNDGVNLVSNPYLSLGFNWRAQSRTR